MSTLSGIVSKGEKGKPKFQSLDINSLYRVSRGESLEQHQQKSTLPRKHGMQSLGKVPSARRPPANLPSLKSEHSNSDPAVSLVPSGGSGWATTKDPSPSPTSTTPNTTTDPTLDTSATNSSPASCVPTTPAPTAQQQLPSLPGQQQQQIQQQQQQQQNTSQSSHPSEAGNNKSSWSAIMSRPGDVGTPVVAAAVVGYAGLVTGVGRTSRGALGLSFLAHQSPQFQHEFPSLSGQTTVSVSNQSQTQQSPSTVSNAAAISVNVQQQQTLLPQQSYSHNHSGGASAGPQQQQSQQNREQNAQYGPGPSLRPQTEGSWIQGGSRASGGAGVVGTGNGNTPAVQGPPLGIGGPPGHSEGPVGGRPSSAQSPGTGSVPVGQHTPQNNQGPSVAPPHQPVPNAHHYRGLIPPFMYRGNFPLGGFPSQFPANVSSGGGGGGAGGGGGGGGNGPRPRFNYSAERFPPPQRQQQERDRLPPPVNDEDIVIPRPIIKEEDLTRMDDIAHDAGWAAHDDIDYNQKLAFSDDETENEPPRQEVAKKDSPPPRDEKLTSDNTMEERERPREIIRERDGIKDSRDLQQQHRWYQDRPGPGQRDFRGSNGPPIRDNYPPPQQHQPQQQPPPQPLRVVHPLRGAEEEEMWIQRRREQGEKVASAVERARQRKEEEEKRFIESTKQAAAKKLQDLEEKLKQAKQKDEESITVSEPKGLISVPPVPIPVPEWEREKESRERENRERDRGGDRERERDRDRERSRTSSEGKDEKPVSIISNRGDNRQSREIVRDVREPPNDFGQVNQRSGGFMRQQSQQQEITRIDREREREREPRDMREPRDQPAFYRHFQNNLPPRFQKQQAERNVGTGNNRVSPNPERNNSQGSFIQQYSDQGGNSGGGAGNNRWSHNNHSNQGQQHMHTPLSGSMKDSHSMPISQRRSKGESDQAISSPMDDEPQRPSSRDHGGLRSREDTGFVQSRDARDNRMFDNRRSTAHYNDYNRGYKDYEHEDRHRNDRRETERHYDDKDTRECREPRDSRDLRDSRDIRDSRDHRDTRDLRDSRDSRDMRESKDNKSDYDNYRKQQSPPQQDLVDERQMQRERPESGEWRDTRREDHSQMERQGDGRRETMHQQRGDDRIERTDRNERPQRPDSRDSRTSRESRTSLRDDDVHKLREIGSWAQEMSDYEEKKRDSYRDDHRDRERDSRWHLPGPVTREKIVADELKSEKRGMTPLKRGGSSVSSSETQQQQQQQQEKKDSPTETKKEADAWNRKLERTPENTRASSDRNDISPKVWSESISPTFDKEDEKLLEPMKDDKGIVEMKDSMSKLCVEDREEATIHHSEDIKDEAKEDKREKNVRNRTNSGGSRSRESRGATGSSGGGGGGRTWQPYNVYGRNWRGPEPRGRRGAGPRSIGRPPSNKSGYGHSEIELSGDEISVAAESNKEERRSAVSPKPSAQKIDKDDRIREVSRRDDKRNADYSQGRNEKRGYDGKPSREGFAPSGEPSRRGRGGFRTRGATTGYGPPPSKSPFSTERSNDEKQQQNNSTQQKPLTPTPLDNSDTSVATSTMMDTNDEKMTAKQQALTAGITGRRNKSPHSQHQANNKQDPSHGNVSQNVQSHRNQPKKEDSRSMRHRSGSRRGRDGRDGRLRGTSGMVKQNSADVGNEDWETTSENSEDHVDEHKDSQNSHGKQFGGRGDQTTNAPTTNSQSRRNEQMRNNREQREKNVKSSGGGSRAPGAEKRNAQNSALNNQRNHAGGMSQSMQNSQTQNGRPRSQGSANSGPPAMSNKPTGKETTVNRMDEIKLNDPNLVDQALNDINKKSSSKDKKVIEVDGDGNSYAMSGDDTCNAEDKMDSDGFQEVRSKKNVKEARHVQKEEPKPARREKDKERERDRSKSKSNGPQQPTPQQVQNIPPLLGQPIPQPANMPSKPFDRNSRGLKLAPRFQKQRMAKQQQPHMGSNNEGGNGESNAGKANNSPGNYMKDSAGGPAPPPSVNAWDKPFTSQMRSNSPSSVPADMQLMSGLTGQNDHSHDNNEQSQQQNNSGSSSQRNSPNADNKTAKGIVKEQIMEKNVSDSSSSPPVQTLIFENTNYSKKTGPSDMAIKAKFSNHMKNQSSRGDKRADVDDDNNGQMQQQQQQQQQQHQAQAMSAAFANKSNDIMKDKSQEAIQMPLSFNKSEDNADMKLDFTFDSDLTQLTDDKSKSLSMTRSMHMAGGQNTMSPSAADLNLKIALVKKVWESAAPMPTVVEHEDGNSVAATNSFPQSFESSDVDDSYSPHQQYNQNNMKNEIATSTNVCKLVPPQVKPQQQSSGNGGAQPGSTVPGPSPIGPGQSPIGHPPASLQGPLSPPPFNSTGQPSHINYQELQQYPGSQAAQYGSMSAIPSPPAVLFNTGSGQLPAQAGGLYGTFQLDQSRSPFSQYPAYGPSLQNSFNQQNVYLQQPPPPPPPHAPNAPTPDMYQSHLSQYRINAAAAPPFGQNQQLSNNPNTVLISSSSNSLMSTSVKPSSQGIGAIGTKAAHFQAPSAPQPNQLAYIPYDPNQVLGVSGNYMGNSQLVQRPGPNVQPSANSYYSPTSADVFPGSQTGFYQPGGAAQQTGTHYGLQGFGQHSQSLATGSATPVGLQNFSSQFLSNSGLQIAAAAAAQQFRNPTGGLPGPAAATFLNKYQQQEQPRQLKSPSGNQQDVLGSVFSSTSQMSSPKSRNCKQQTQSQQPQPTPSQHHKYQQHQGVSQSALVLQQNVRGMGMPPRAGIQPSQQRYPPPIQRPVVPFQPGPNPNNPSQQQQNCMPNQQPQQQQQQQQMNRHRPNLHQQQQPQRNMKIQQQYYSGQGNVKMDSNDKAESHNEKIADGTAANQGGGNKSNVSQQDVDNKEEVNQQNE